MALRHQHSEPTQDEFQGIDLRLTQVETYGRWQTWTPSSANLDAGNGSVTARYCQVGKLVHFDLSIVWGSTTSISGAVNLSLPVTAHARAGTATAQPVAQAEYLDASASSTLGTVVYASTTDIRLLYHPTLTTSANVSATAPFTWTTSDEIHIHGWYEAA